MLILTRLMVNKHVTVLSAKKIKLSETLGGKYWFWTKKMEISSVHEISIFAESGNPVSSLREKMAIIQFSDGGLDWLNIASWYVRCCIPTVLHPYALTCDKIEWAVRRIHTFSIKEAFQKRHTRLILKLYLNGRNSVTLIESKKKRIF